MPFARATFPLTAIMEQAGSAIIARAPAALAASGQLDASIGAALPFGNVATLASLGFDAGTAPARAAMLTVAVRAGSVESPQASAVGGASSAFAGLRIFVEEFDASGRFLRGVSGPTTIAFDFRATVIGFAARLNERRVYTATFVLPIVGGRFYRVWADSLQAVFVQGITGAAFAISIITYTLDPVFFAFG